MCFFTKFRIVLVHTRCHGSILHKKLFFKKKLNVHKVPLNCQSTDKMLLNFGESVKVGGEIGKIGIIGGARGYA